ncbi:hypothetical protein [Limosilactobacillus sp.]|uniref:hypothetical protein n=1 Tax=Limosilactobacillus sp. TaxID=2773925 RepID=UPI0025C2BB32|nr:hypothetical protein [Limosilactobacillus sp.]MCH3922835.1 hypothetical protein [Limosilactobacillus sp.]MCH3927518.1 hypothetical protein [Limosilactobacillus sp.]
MNEPDWWAATVADRVWSRQQAQKIISRLNHLFANVPDTRYWILVNACKQINGYNLFFNCQRKRAYQRSWPIAQLKDSSFEQLLAVLAGVRTKYNFTFEYVHFTREQRRILHEEVD